MSIVEAFACGTPVICSRLGSMQELVDEGKTGILFEPGNPSELASVVRGLTNNPARLSAMRARAREQYEECYTPENNYRQLIQIYEATITLQTATAAFSFAERSG
jgi:glycosyltransferase involved in cell wall biosynthesis